VLDSKRWEAKTALDELHDARIAVQNADAADRENEAQAALEGRDRPKPTHPAAVKRLQDAQRAADAQGEASRRAAHAFVAQVWAHRDQWTADASQARSQARDRLLDQLAEVRQSFQRIAVLDYLLAALHELEQSGSNLSGWALCPSTGGTAADPLAMAHEPRGNWLSRSRPMDVDEALGELAKHLAPISEPEQTDHPADSPFRESTIATVASRAALTGG
jgi:hypothetical protein